MPVAVNRSITIPLPMPTLRDPVRVSIVQGSREGARRQHPGRAHGTPPRTGVIGRSAHARAPAAMHCRQTMDETRRVTGTRRADPARGGGGSGRTRSIRRRQPAQAAPRHGRIRSATSRKVRRQAGVEAGRPRNADRPRAPRDRGPRRRRRRPPPAPGRRSMRASHGWAVRAPCARVLCGPSSFTLAEIARGPQGPPSWRRCATIRR